MANSLMLLCPMLGVDFAIGCPDGYEPSRATLDMAKEIASRYGTQMARFERPEKAVEGADVVYTDVWTSMGQEAEAEQRRKVFPPYQVNSRLLAHAKRDAIVMHCLPAHRGAEITADVIDGNQSVVYHESENRLHVQKAVLVLLIGAEPGQSSSHTAN
jgi:ornithine carbamoyltransferase